MPGCDSLYLSPHLDDAVLSCAGRILAECRAARRVVVATLFANGGTDAESRRLYERRRAEDVQALTLLGAEPVHCFLADAPFRHQFYRGFRTIVLEEQPYDGAAVVTQVAAVIRDLCQRHQPARCYVALAVGTHIDHRHTYSAARSLPRGPEIVYYEDRPYAFVRHSLRSRFRELGVRIDAAELPDELRPRSADRLAAEFVESFRQTTYVQSYLPPGHERDRCEEALLRRLTGPVAAEALVLRPETNEADEEAWRQIVRAVFTYRSQVGELFGTLRSFWRQTDDYTRRLGSAAAYAERFWRPVFPPCDGSRNMER